MEGALVAAAAAQIFSAPGFAGVAKGPEFAGFGAAAATGATGKEAGVEHRLHDGLDDGKAGVDDAEGGFQAGPEGHGGDAVGNV